MLVVVFASYVGWSGTSFASETHGRMAIQNRRYNMAHEISLAVGSMPLDAFQKGWTAGLSYTAHLSDHWSWEILSAHFAHLTSTDLRNELLDTFAIPQEDFAAPRFLVTTGVQLSPIYGKMVLLNRRTVHQAIFVGLHAGVAFGDRVSFTDILQDFRPATGIGLGYRIMLSPTTSIRIDVRDFLTFRRPVRANESIEIENILLITGGLSFNLGRDDA